MAAVRRKLLRELDASAGGIDLITAIIINKSTPNIFLSKETNEFRGVICFTLRDSKRHLTNCKFWGSKEKVEAYQRQLKIGNVIDIIGARVLPRAVATTTTTEPTSASERYQPQTTLPFSLVVNEENGYMEQHERNDFALLNELRHYMHLPHKSVATVLNLADVRCSLSEHAAQQTMPQFVDLLVAIASLRPAKTIRSARNGQQLQCLEMIVHDASWPDGMILTIWNNDWIERAAHYWTPRRTILHLIDARVSYSDFYKSTALSCAACTLIYENPTGEEVQHLLEFAARAPFKDVDWFAQAGAESLPRADEIRTQMTVRQIYARVEGDLAEATTENFTAVLYAMITKFDIDGLAYIISRKCKNCQRLIPSNRHECDNEQCQLEFSLNYSGTKFDNFFNINLQCSDHTGTLVEARLSSEVAERILELQVSEYFSLTQSQKAALKWRFLMNHVELKLLIKKPAAMRRKLAIIVVDLRIIDIDELAKKFLVF